MQKNTGYVGGFAAFNNGTIENSYSYIKLNAKKQMSAGFAGENAGIIRKSLAMCKINKTMTGGFSGNNNAEDSCYFFHSEKEGSKKLQKLCDPHHGQRLKTVQSEKEAQELGFDTEVVWEYTGAEPLLRFQAEHWFYEVAQSTTTAEDIVKISTPEELFDLAKNINEGNRALASAYIQLVNDIDLGGREWTPIGRERTLPFHGVFDGAGYTVKNFVIKSKETENKGFFGFLNGEVYNLTVDCHIKGGNVAGGIAAICEADAVIGCCAAIIELSGKKGSYGGLAGRNSGRIFHSYAAGKITFLVIPWIFGLPVLLLLLFLLFFTKNPIILPSFAPVPYDPDQDPIPGETIEPNADGNFASFQFEEHIDVDLATGLCKFGFKNPGNSNHNIVIQLQFTDEQAIRIMGSTGRSEEDQKKLDDNPDYDPAVNRMIIAESGAIQIGYQLENLRLVEQPNGAAIPPGEYNAIVYLMFYDIETNERAMLESQLPVVISVH